MPTATTIDDVIAFAALDIATLSYVSSDPLLTAVDAWVAGMFGAAGIFPPDQNTTGKGGQRVVTNWYATTLMARNEIEGPDAGDAGVVATSDVIDAVVRAATAVKYGLIDQKITSDQEDDVVTLYNTCFVPPGP